MGFKAFISYSHMDEHALERFTKHLAVLRREGAIDEWFDQKIPAGGDIDTAISGQLDDCDLFLPLISADFLSSGYCYDLELKRALERHEQGSLRVVPIIVQPCDWEASPLGRLKALPKDSKPVADWTNENTAWLDVVAQLRRLAEELPSARHEPAPITGGSKAPRIPKYRVKKDFDEVDKLEFRDRAFRELYDYFQQASDEINGIENIKSKFTTMSATSFTCTVVNRARDRGVAHITVYAGSTRHSFGDISYSFQERADPGTSNGWLQIEADDYELYLKHNGMMRDEKAKLSSNQAAVMLWEEFVEQAGISYE